MNVLLEIVSPHTSAAVERLGWTLVHSLWQFLLVALAAAAAARAMRGNSSAIRYGVLVLAMTASVAAPAATWVLQPVFGSPPRHTAAFFAPPLDETHARDHSPRADGYPSRQNSAGVAGPNALTGPRPGLTARDGHDPLHPESSRFSRAQAVLRPWFTWIVAGWSLGVIVCSLRPLLGWRTLRRLRRLGTSAVSDEVLTAMGRVSRRLGVRRATRVMQSTLAQAPVVVGYLRPVILLPVSLMTDIPTRQLEAILAHELAHVRRHDFVVNLLQTLVETIFFYHPAVWWLSRQIRIEREHCCDDLAVIVLGSRVEYGRALLAVEELRGQRPLLALGAAGGSLLSRIRRIADATPAHRAATWADRWPAALLGLALFGLVCLASVNQKLAAKDEAPEPAGREAAAAANGDVRKEALRHSDLSHPNDIPTAADPKSAPADEQAFHDAARIDAERHAIEFFRPPTAGALRHLQRLPGDWTITVQWPGAMDKSAAAGFKGGHVKSVSAIELADPGSIDAWLKELARPDSGLKALTTLDFRGTQISDEGLKELTRPGNGLKALTSLSLRKTKLTEAGLKELARAGSGLEGLASLDLGETNVTDADLNEFARPDTGLKNLTALDLYRTQVTDAGLKTLARPDSGLKALTTLSLNGTKVTDAGLKEIARTDSGLKSLTSLDLIRTQVTDVGLKELARPDSGVKALASLDLYGTQVTDAGIKEFARPDGSLNHLTFLRLGLTRVTDTGLKEIARPKTGLKSLTALDLSDTPVTDAGLKELARPDSGVQGIATLSLWATQVTDTGLLELTRPDSGLKALASLYLHRTKTTDASVEALQKARPGLRIER